MIRMKSMWSGSWVRQAEHGLLRLVSLLFSMASAYAIRLFFAPLDLADPGEKYITWGVAIGFGILGYIVSRGLVHRLMLKESIWSYAPICLLVELVDIACNYILAASVVRQAWWLSSVPDGQRGVLTVITYVVLSVIPLVSLFLAVVDMDLERSKQGAGIKVGVPNVPNGKPLLKQGMPSQPAAPLLQGGQSQGGTTQGASPTNGTAAKRATFWSGRQGQQGDISSARTLIHDPEKDGALAGVP